MGKLISKIASLFEIIKVIARHEPLYLWFALPQIIINAALPLLYIYFPRLIIERLTGDYTYANVAAVIGGYTALLLVANVTNVFLKQQSGLRAEMFSTKLKNQTGKLSMNLELADIEGTSTRDLIALANKASELTGTMALAQGIVSNIITIAGLVVLVSRLSFLLAFILIPLGVHYVFLRTQLNFAKKLREADARNSRCVEYMHSLSYFNEGGAKEIRVNALQDWYMAKVAEYRGEMVHLAFRSFRMFAWHNIVSAVVLAGQSFIILWLLSLRYIDGAISIAEFTMYFAAVTTLSTTLSSIAEQFGNFGKQVLNVSDYKRFEELIGLTSNDQAEIKNRTFTLNDTTEIAFDNVSFTYPGNEKQVLSGVSIKIKNGEKLVIVGENGAGKSTFIKLLCKFYRPTSGTITLNGKDIWDIPNEEYYKTIAAVFQDFQNLAFTIGENVAMREDWTAEQVESYIDNVGLGERVAQSETGLATYITKAFDSSGTELSGGQAQKLAIARAMYKNAPILILDEPTANLDPQAESEIYTNFFNMSRGRTTIFISHRLAASTLADNIAVFGGGRVVEYGSHKELVGQGGVYGLMYEKQSGQYVEKRGK